MELGVMERLLLLNTLTPVEGNITLLRLVRGLQERLSFSEAELEALDFKQKGAQMTWTPGTPDVAFDFSPKELKVIAGQLKQLNASNKLTLQHMNLYAKFCPDDEAED